MRFAGCRAKMGSTGPQPLDARAPWRRRRGSRRDSAARRVPPALSCSPAVEGRTQDVQPAGCRGDALFSRLGSCNGKPRADSRSSPPSLLCRSSRAPPLPRQAAWRIWRTPHLTRSVLSVVRSADSSLLFNHGQARHVSRRYDQVRTRDWQGQGPRWRRRRCNQGAGFGQGGACSRRALPEAHQGRQGQGRQGWRHRRHARCRHLARGGDEAGLRADDGDDVARGQPRLWRIGRRRRG